MYLLRVHELVSGAGVTESDGIDEEAGKLEWCRVV